MTKVKVDYAKKGYVKGETVVCTVGEFTFKGKKQIISDILLLNITLRGTDLVTFYLTSVSTMDLFYVGHINLKKGQKFDLNRDGAIIYDNVLHYLNGEADGWSLGKDVDRALNELVACLEAKEFEA